MESLKHQRINTNCTVLYYKTYKGIQILHTHFYHFILISSFFFSIPSLIKSKKIGTWTVSLCCLRMSHPHNSNTICHNYVSKFKFYSKTNKSKICHSDKISKAWRSWCENPKIALKTVRAAGFTIICSFSKL